MWVISEITPEFEKSMLDVLEVYERPYDQKKPVICLDEKSKQLLLETREPVMAQPGTLRKYDYEYKRNGTVNLFVAVEPKGKKRRVKVTKHRRKKDYALFMRYLVDRVYKDAEKIIVVEDNLNTHNEASLIEAFGETEGKRVSAKIEWHFTPYHASWLNRAERDSCVRGTMFEKADGTFQDMQSEVAACVRKRNRDRVGINWQFTREKAKEKFHLTEV